MGAPSASKSPSALSAQALRAPPASRAGLIIVGFDASHLASNYSVQSLIFWLKTAPVGEGAVEINERGLYQLLDAKNDLDLEIL